MPLPHFRLRSLLIAVAVVAVFLAAGTWGGKMWQRSGLYRQQAGYHRDQLGIIVDPPYLNPQQYHDVQERISRRRGWHGAMAEKYELAALRPWIPLEPDSPEPK